jgi:hypothetical protein
MTRRTRWIATPFLWGSFIPNTMPALAGAFGRLQVLQLNQIGRTFVGTYLLQNLQPSPCTMPYTGKSATSTTGPLRLDLREITRPVPSNAAEVPCPVERINDTPVMTADQTAVRWCISSISGQSLAGTANMPPARATGLMRSALGRTFYP